MLEDGKWEIADLGPFEDMDEREGAPMGMFTIRCPEGHTRELKQDEAAERYLLCEECEEQYRFLEEE